MKAKLIAIGNSRGIRIPKPMIKEAQLDEEVEISVRDRTIVIASTRNPRTGWMEAARQLHEQGDDNLKDSDTPTKFDQNEWTW